eukprot:767381-Hanusia_phi.AAC.2
MSTSSLENRKLQEDHNVEIMIMEPEQKSKMKQDLLKTKDTKPSCKKLELFVRRPSLEDDCPVLLQLASHHNVLQQSDLDRCGSFAIRRSSLVVGDLLGQGSSGE